MTSPTRSMLVGAALAALLATTSACGSTLGLRATQATDGLGGVQVNGASGSDQAGGTSPGPGAAAQGGTSAQAAGGPGGQAAVGGVAGGGSGGSSVTGAGGGATTAGGGRTPGVAGGPATTAASRSGGGGTTSPAPGQGTAGAEVGDGPGVTATTITFGSSYNPNGGATNAALGASNIGTGDQQAQLKAVIAYVNAHGGIAGRQVTPIFYPVNSTDSADTVAQGACNFWEQDHKTFVFDSTFPIDRQCAERYHAVGLFTAIVDDTEAGMAKLPDNIDLAGITIDRSMTVTVAGLAKQGYFAKGAKVGVVTWDEADYQGSAQNVAVPAIEAAGVPSTDVTTAFVSTPQDNSELASTSASVSNAVLRLHTAGVDHVIIFDGSAGAAGAGVLCLEWMQQANSQNYYPRYGLNSSSGFSTLAPDFPAKEMVGSIGVGWDPALDLTASDYGAQPQTPQQKTCLQIMAAAGQAPSNGNEQSIEFNDCDQLFFLQHALAGVKGPLNQQDAMAAINAVGTSYQDIPTFGIDITPRQHDGVGEVRNVAFDASCTCYRYTSAPYPTS